ncbi:MULTISPECIES: 1-phosphofructokinase family hexose kinase [Enterobacterales]|uniref:1-phosphofructokinase family hexose kinase n=1 Tax=Enterobacterales TaxID=91347 RepID=UPI002ED7A09D
MKVLIASINTAIERLLRVEEQQPGDVHRLLEDSTLAGGKGVNVARVLRQLQPLLENTPSPLLIGFLGGATGRLCQELLAQENLPGRWCNIAGNTRICEVITEEKAPERASVYNAAGPVIQPDEHQQLHNLLNEALPDSSALICTGSLARNLASDEYAHWISTAREHGVLTLLDAQGPALSQAISARPDIIKINRDELRQASNGIEQNLPAAWCKQGVHCVIITDGPNPVVAHTPDGVFTITPPVVNTVSSVGSGDAYCAGLITSLLARPHAGWEAHLTLAAACGAANASSPTAGLPADADLVALQQHCTVSRSTDR